MGTVDEKIWALEREREMLMLSCPLLLAAYLFVGCHELTLFPSQTIPPPPFHAPYPLCPPLIALSPLFWQDIKFTRAFAPPATLGVVRDRDVAAGSRDNYHRNDRSDLSFRQNGLSFTTVCHSANQSLSLACLGNASKINH